MSCCPKRLGPAGPLPLLPHSSLRIDAKINPVTVWADFFGHIACVYPMYIPPLPLQGGGGGGGGERLVLIGA